ncbi:hypothetical protein [Streptomyces sp. NPDC003374]
MDSSIPPGFSGRTAALRKLGTSRTIPASASATMGTLTRKTEPHQKWSSRTPASTGPAAMPTPADVEEMAMAVARPGPVKVHSRMPEVRGHDQRGADAHRGPGGDQLARVAGVRRPDRGAGEDNQPWEARS